MLKNLILMSWHGQVRAWHADTLLPAATLEGHSGAVRALAATGSRVFSGSDDHTVRVWDTGALRCLATLKGHTDNVRVLAVNERYAFSGSWDRTIRSVLVLELTCGMEIGWRHSFPRVCSLVRSRVRALLLIKDLD